jgi:hypothetical protein
VNRSATAVEPHKSGMRMFWIALTLFVLLAVVLVLSSPWWHDKYFGMAGNESAAVSVLRNINVLEKRHAATHVEKGFTCVMTQLRESQLSSDAHDSSAALLTGQSRGYKFALVGCAAEANGVATHYQVTAVPVKPYGTGVRAFCTDQTGNIFYDHTGTASECLAARQLLR